jgi:malate dehydrogenase
VQGYTADQLDAALEGVEAVVIPAGVPRKVFIISTMNTM